MKVLSTSRWPPVQDVRLGWSLIFGSRNAVPGTSGVGVVVVRDVSIVQRLSSESRQQMQWLKYWCWEPTGLCGFGCRLLDAVRFSLLPGKVRTGVVRRAAPALWLLHFRVYALIAGSHWP